MRSWNEGDDKNEYDIDEKENKQGENRWEKSSDIDG